MIPKLTPDECVHMAIHTQNIHLRQYWMKQAQLMIDVNKPPSYDERYAEGGLTMATGGLYRQQVGQVHRAKMERIQRYGTSY